MSEDDPIEMPIAGMLDLHTFRPQEVGDLVPEYLRACRGKGILQARIVYGKGTGALRRTVLATLRKHPDLVARVRAGDEASGSWGATVVDIRPDPGSPS